MTVRFSVCCGRAEGSCRWPYGNHLVAFSWPVEQYQRLFPAEIWVMILHAAVSLVLMDRSWTRVWKTEVTELNRLEKVTCLKECLCPKASLWDLDVFLSFFWKGSPMGEGRVGLGGSRYWEMNLLLPNPEWEETAERFCGVSFWTNQKYAVIVKMAFQGLTALVSNDAFPSCSWGLEAWCVGTWSVVLKPAGSSGLETCHCWTHRVALLLIST